KKFSVCLKEAFMREKRTWAGVAALVVGLFVAGALVQGCVPPPTAPEPTHVDVNVGQNVAIGNGTQPGSTTPGSSGPCNPVDSVEATAPTSSIRVGSSVALDATPLDRTKTKRDAACDRSDGVRWSRVGPCSLDNDASFNPIVTGSAAGTCYLQAIVT